MSVADAERPFRVAVASRDAKLVQQHFGQATQFLIYEVRDGVAKLSETRKCEPACDPALREHDAQRMEGMLGLVADCQVVVAAMIGPGALRLLEERGIQGVVAPGFIDVVFARLRRTGVLPGAEAQKERSAEHE